MNRRMELRFASLAEHVGLARLAAAFAAAQAGFTAPEIEEVKVAVSEAVTNCVIHAYPDGVGEVRVELVPGSGVLEVTIHDRGVGMRATADSVRPIDLSKGDTGTGEPEGMGLGFVFMRNFMDHVAVTSRPGHGTTVHMEKRAQRAAATAAGSAG
jgi:stage II sporulation protein AB (anti-sigma F factor)